MLLRLLSLFPVLHKNTSIWLFIHCLPVNFGLRLLSLLLLLLLLSLLLLLLLSLLLLLLLL